MLKLMLKLMLKVMLKRLMLLRFKLSIEFSKKEDAHLSDINSNYLALLQDTEHSTTVLKSLEQKF